MNAHEEMDRNLDAWNFTARQREAVRAMLIEHRDMLARLEAIEEDVAAVHAGEPPKVSIYRQAEQLRKLWPATRRPGDATPPGVARSCRKPAAVDPQAFREAWLRPGSIRKRASSLGMSRRRAVKVARSLGLEVGSEG